MRFVRVVPRVKVPEGAVRTDLVIQRDKVVIDKLTYPVNVTTHVFGKGRNTSSPNMSEGLGTLETYVCSKCGFVEWYCWDPDEIPIGSEYMTDVVEYGSDKPYR